VTGPLAGGAVRSKIERLSSSRRRFASVTTPITPSRKSAPRIHGAAECFFVVVSVVTASLRAAVASAAPAGGTALVAAASPVPLDGGGGFVSLEDGFTEAAPAALGSEADGEEAGGCAAGLSGAVVAGFSVFF
jgi:hypothetical protein